MNEENLSQYCEDIDDIINTTEVNKPKKKFKAKKVLIIALCVVVFIFVFRCVCWYIFMNTEVKTVKDIEGLALTSSMEPFDTYDGYFNEDNINGKICTNIPHFLNFTCNVFVNDETPLYWEDKSDSTYYLEFEVSRYFLSEDDLSVSITEEKPEVVIQNGGETTYYQESATVGFSINKQGEIIDYEDISDEDLDLFNHFKSDIQTKLKTIVQQDWSI